MSSGYQWYLLENSINEGITACVWLVRVPRPRTMVTLARCMLWSGLSGWAVADYLELCGGPGWNVFGIGLVSPGSSSQWSLSHGVSWRLNRG